MRFMFSRSSCTRHSCEFGLAGLVLLNCGFQEIAERNDNHAVE